MRYNITGCHGYGQNQVNAAMRLGLVSRRGISDGSYIPIAS